MIVLSVNLCYQVAVLIFLLQVIVACASSEDQPGVLLTQDTIHQIF